MARILYLHGSSAGPFGIPTELLERHGHEVVSTVGGALAIAASPETSAGLDAGVGPCEVPGA